MYPEISIKIKHVLFIETVVSMDESKKNKVDDDYSIQSADGKMSKSEIKIARQSQRKRYYTYNLQISFFNKKIVSND